MPSYLMGPAGVTQCFSIAGVSNRKPSENHRKMVVEWDPKVFYPLVIEHGNGTSPMNEGFNRKITYNVPFSIAMFNYWRVTFSSDRPCMDFRKRLIQNTELPNTIRLFVGNKAETNLALHNGRK